MRRPSLHLLTLFALLIAGCGGSDHDSSSSPSPFQESYSGTYEAAFLEDTGTYDVTVTRSGSITGTGTSDNGGSGNPSGRFSSSGDFTGRISFPSNGTSGTLTGT